MLQWWKIKQLKLQLCDLIAIYVKFKLKPIHIIRKNYLKQEDSTLDNEVFLNIWFYLCDYLTEIMILDFLD